MRKAIPDWECVALTRKILYSVCKVYWTVFRKIAGHRNKSYVRIQKRYQILQNVLDV